MKLLKFPEFRQVYEYDCGASAVQSILAYYGFDVPEGKLIKWMETNSKEGTRIAAFKKIAKKFGFKCKAGEMNIALLKKVIDKGTPAIIGFQAWSKRKIKDWENNWNNGHFAIPIGYDEKRIYFEDPGCVMRTYLPFTELEKRWHMLDEKKRLKHFGILFYGRKPNYDINRAIHIGQDKYKFTEPFRKYKQIK